MISSRIIDTRWRGAGWLAAIALGVVAAVGGSARAEGAPHEKAPEPAPTPTSTTTRFDGDWTIALDCPPAAGADRIAYDFPASVLNGKLFGSRGAQGAPGALQVDGAIGADGNAALQAHGRTAEAPAGAARLPAGSVYSYEIQAHFDDARGTGRRLQDRACDFTFTRR